MKLVSQELGQFNFLSQAALNEISVKGVFGQNLKKQNQQAEINGLYIILVGIVNIEFMGIKLQAERRKIINLCLIEMMNDQKQGRVQFEQADNNDILYFFIDQEQFNGCLQQQFEKEKYQMIKEDIIFNNNTKQLNFQCHFCKQFHPTFNCVCLNIKGRFTYDKTNQERGPMFKRKNNNRTKAAIYQQGTSNYNVFEMNSDSFEAFSDFSSDKLSLSNQHMHHELIGKQTSISQIQKDMLQIDIISDKITDPIISSTFIKHFQVHESTQKHHAEMIQAGFQELDVLMDVDKFWEYEHYNINFNLNNVIQKLNKQKFFENFLQQQ
ncbi:unnamed protein product (macronuclear) [Paramecium tetraurelia]|uniref:Cyclic nucleotide-binding domain-containing protein n=1 Tax=Paramecium tetraurelia TaxID=5888 RepID=A0BY15_PARTE|nr:uncharacterized protein GSPATT00033285001 [Paramecium tetraurelia]CAK63432.1 unnamed protein product [Paramecium tetraurelia]|eukprot:XP_001430830.1 hypothetical protein (macronuclear) [Paramecium tetraurelia strain d4-2]